MRCSLPYVHFYVTYRSCPSPCVHVLAMFGGRSDTLVAVVGHHVGHDLAPNRRSTTTGRRSTRGGSVRSSPSGPSGWLTARSPGGTRGGSASGPTRPRNRPGGPHRRSGGGSPSCSPSDRLLRGGGHPDAGPRRVPDGQSHLLRWVDLLHHGRVPAVRPGRRCGLPRVRRRRRPGAPLFVFRPRQIDWSAAVIQSVGTIFFNVSTGHAVAVSYSSAGAAQPRRLAPRRPRVDLLPRLELPLLRGGVPRRGAVATSPTSTGGSPWEIWSARWPSVYPPWPPRHWCPVSCAVSRGRPSARSWEACASSAPRSCCCPNAPRHARRRWCRSVVDGGEAAPLSR